MSDHTGSQAAAPLSYRDAGVDIEAGDALVDRIAPAARRTRRPEVLGGLGGFAALCRIPQGYQSPILVSGTDGVGTKLRLAMQLNRHDQIGIDLVAMCVNDLLVCGAEPLFFLDYYATGKLSVETAATVIEGIAAGCSQAGCALVGGETAEMPGMYEGEDYDLAGFCVGVVEESRILDGSRVAAGDVLIGLASSGAHSNGYSLIRKIIDTRGIDLQQILPGTDQSLADALMQPTRIYVSSILQLLRDPALGSAVHAMAHITGGGLPGNLPRVLPAGVDAVVDANALPYPPLFQWLQAQGQVELDEMYRAFNCGIGFILVVAAAEAEAVTARLNQLGETAFRIGQLQPATSDTQPAQVFRR